MQRNIELGRKCGRRLMTVLGLVVLGMVVPVAVSAQGSQPRPGAPPSGGFPGGGPAAPAVGSTTSQAEPAVPLASTPTAPEVVRGPDGLVIVSPKTDVRQQRQESSSGKPQPQESVKKDAASGPKQTKKAKSNGKWSVRISTGPPLLVTVKNAQDVSVADLAAEISKKTKIPFVLSELIQEQSTTADFADLPFEAAVRYLAPSGFIDYSVRADYSEAPKPLFVYLGGINEKVSQENVAIIHNEQAKDAVAKGYRLGTIVISGDTDASTDNPTLKRKQELFLSGQFDKLEEENPIKVSYRSGRVSVSAQKQSLMAVISAIAVAADIEANIDGWADETNPLHAVDVTVDKKNATLEEVLMSLSPYIVLHVRTDIETSFSSPIRIILVPPKPYAVPATEDAVRTR